MTSPALKQYGGILCGLAVLLVLFWRLSPISWW